jgi:hypothetical protein
MKLRFLMSDKYFLHNEEDGCIYYFNTKEEALIFARELIGELNDGDGWPSELLDGGIKIGVVIHESGRTNEHPVTINEEGKSVDYEGNIVPEEWTFTCDVEMIETEVKTTQINKSIEELDELRDKLFSTINDLDELRDELLLSLNHDNDNTISTKTRRK